MSLSLMATQVTFTEVWTTHTKQFYVNPYWTITQFLESIRTLIKNEFKTEFYEIVEAGQHIPGIASEDAPAIINSQILIDLIWLFQNFRLKLNSIKTPLNVFSILKLAI